MFPLLSQRGNDSSHFLIRSINDFIIIVTLKLTTVPIVVITIVFITSVDEIFIKKTVSIPPTMPAFETVWLTWSLTRFLLDFFEHFSRFHTIILEVMKLKLLSTFLP